MIKMIGIFIDKGYVYVVRMDEGSEVLFDIVLMLDYGGLLKCKLED